MKTLSRALSAVLIATAVSAGMAEASVPKDRFGFVHGCWSLQNRDDGQAIGAASGPFRMQATRLGDYLLFGVQRDFLGDPGTGVPTAAAEPSANAEWSVRGSRDTGYSITNLATGKIFRVTFTQADGCAVYPEAQVNATGTPGKGEQANGRLFGWVDGHMHWTGFELFGGDWHCGRPWHPYGVVYALPDCSKYDVGTNEVLRALMDGRTPGEDYDSVGWPSFNFWPGPNKLADEGSYYTSVERAWLSGLRVVVVDFVDNEAMCDVMTVRHNPCHDMESVRIQNRELEQLEDYVDAQNGGPGEGWMRIVTSPQEAREVVKDGKLAVVKGIELSRVLDCGEVNDIPECDREDVDRGLDEIRGMGIRSFFPVHKFDNAFGGTKMDGGETGVIVNSGNHKKTNHWWKVGPCDGPTSDQEQLTAPGLADVADLLYEPLGLLPMDAVLPLYPHGPHCNQRGLTDLGKYLIGRMIDQHFLIEVDHMDEKTADATLDILEDRHYSGVINSHGGWSSSKSVARMLALGGISTFGSDINGLAGQPGSTASTPITYPFTSRDGRVTFEREVWGNRTFDINVDGVANYGLRADWIEAQRIKYGESAMTNFFDTRGAEAYLRMWERAWEHGE